MLRRYIVERNLPRIGSASTRDLRQAAQTARLALAELGPGIQWVDSYVCADKTYCIYLAESEELVRRESEMVGMPVDALHEVVRIIDPATASAVARLRA
jgi:hypothetical protein